MTDSQKLIIYRLGLIILVVAAIYGNTLNHGFVWDDTYIIDNNPILEHLSNIPRFFLTEDTIEESTGYYRPMTYISFALERAIWGGNPVGYHLTNILLHMIAAMLFYAVIAGLFNRERLAFIAALVFALHPIAGETVNFLAGGRNTLLSACFALMSLLFHIRKKQIPAVACFTAAIFSKEFALLLPVIYLLHDLRLRSEGIRYARYIPYLVSMTCYLALRSIAVQKANFISAINLSDSATAPYLVVRYALNMILPFQLKVLYELQTNLIIPLLCFVTVIIMIAAIYFFRKHDDIQFSICWFLLFLLPVINIIPLHTITVMADRYAYFSLMGFALFLAALVCKLNRRIVAVAVVTLCAVYAFIDVSRNSIWKDDIAFFTRMTKDAPDKFAGFKNLGMSYYKKGDLAPAVRYLVIGDTKPDIPFKYLVGDAYILWKENMPEKAEQSLLRAMQLEPGNPEPYLVLMLIHEESGNKILAQAYRDKVKEMGYRIDDILKNRTIELCRAGETYLARRQFIDGEIYFWQALKIDPDYIPALIDMGSLKAEQGDYANAINYLNKALAIDPMNAPAHYNLSMVFLSVGRTSEAEKEMNRFSEAEIFAKQKGNAAPR